MHVVGSLTRMGPNLYLHMCSSNGQFLRLRLYVHFVPFYVVIRLAFGFYGISVVSSIFYGVFLCVVGVMDEGCGIHGNFSNLMQNVIDNNQSWGESYPLGAAILGNTSYPLTVGGVLDGCHRNQSLFTVLQLDHQYNLSDIIDIPHNESVGQKK